MSELHWKTAITEVLPNKVSLRGYPIDELMGKISFAQAIYLVLKGKFPSPEVGKLVDAMFVSSVDHGGSPPSVLAARTVASTGSELNSAIASGVLAISRYHGGAIEGCMRVLLEAVARKREKGQDALTAARELVTEYRAQKKRIPGYGHRIHSEDPRTVKLFAICEEEGVAGEYVEMGGAIREAMKETLGKDLPMNVDGAIAAVLCELDFPPEMGNGLFAIARMAGLVAHVTEEQTRERPMRRIHPTAHEYDGPEELVIRD